MMSKSDWRSESAMRELEHVQKQIRAHEHAIYEHRCIIKTLKGREERALRVLEGQMELGGYERDQPSEAMG